MGGKLAMNNNTKLLLDFTDRDFTAPHQLELYNYWLSLRNGRKMPSRSDIQIEQLKGYLPSIMLFDFDNNNDAFIFRLIGTYCVDLYGEQTGKSVNDFAEHEPAIERLLWCVQNQKPYYAIKNLGNIDKKYINTSFIVLPLSEDDKNVNKILASHHFY